MDLLDVAQHKIISALLGDPEAYEFPAQDVHVTCTSAWAKQLQAIRQTCHDMHTKAEKLQKVLENIIAEDALVIDFDCELEYLEKQKASRKSQDLQKQLCLDEYAAHDRDEFNLQESQTQHDYQNFWGDRASNPSELDFDTDYTDDDADSYPYSDYDSQDGYMGPDCDPLPWEDDEEFENIVLPDLDEGRDENSTLDEDAQQEDSVDESPSPREEEARRQRPMGPWKPENASAMPPCSPPVVLSKLQNRECVKSVVLRCSGGDFSSYAPVWDLRNPRGTIDYRKPILPGMGEMLRPVGDCLTACLTFSSKVGPSLERLSIFGVPHHSLKEVECCSNLKELTLQGVPLTDDLVNSMEGLKTLQKVAFLDCPAVGDAICIDSLTKLVSNLSSLVELHCDGLPKKFEAGLRASIAKQSQAILYFS